MNKPIVLLGLIMLGALTLISAMAADPHTDFKSVTPAGYDYSASVSCISCKYQAKGKWGRGHHENVMGLKNFLSGEELEITGNGWISSKHARSMDTINSSSYCANCHAPTYKKIVADETKSKMIKKDRPGMSCGGCHLSHDQAAIVGTRTGNLMPGTDTTDLDNWIPRKMEKGKQANKQCLWCHTDFHGFADNVIGKMKTGMVKAGTLRCIDCHMAVYNTMDSGTEERFHNMKVAANGKYACNHCHKKATGKWVTSNIPYIFSAHKGKDHKLPGEK